MKLSLCFLFTVFLSLEVSAIDIQFKYSKKIDQECERKTGFKVTTKSIVELNRKLPQLQKIWNKRSPYFLEAIKRITGKSFDTKNITASVFICFQSSYSNPLKLWVGPYLNSYVQGMRSDKNFVRLVLHEILHVFSVENLEGKNTKLMKKYSSESQIAKGHLHVMAMQKAIFLELKLFKELETHMAQEISFGGGYARAWKIINEIEGHQPFINELIGDRRSKFYKPVDLLDRLSIREE